MSITESERYANVAFDHRLQKDEARLMQAINRTNVHPDAWSSSEVREIAATALAYVRYIQKLRQEKEAAE